MICTISKHAAEAKGFGDALMLDYRGYVAETTGANLFLVMNGEIHTPKPDCFLNGITRRTVIDLAQKRGLNVIERHIQPDELKDVQEIFVTGTAAEVTPVRAIDDLHYQLGPGHQAAHRRLPRRHARPRQGGLTALSRAARFSVGVFCGSRPGPATRRTRPPRRWAGDRPRGWRLVYGGGDVGLMGTARAPWRPAAEVLGIIPQRCSIARSASATSPSCASPPPCSSARSS